MKGKKENYFIIALCILLVLSFLFWSVGVGYYSSKADYVEKNYLSLEKEFVELHKDFVNCYYSNYAQVDYEGFKTHFSGLTEDMEALQQDYVIQCFYVSGEDWEKYWKIRNGAEE